MQRKRDATELSNAQLRCRSGPGWDGHVTKRRTDFFEDMALDLSRGEYIFRRQKIIKDNFFFRALILRKIY